MILKSLSESIPFIWLQFTPKTTVLHNLPRASLVLGGTREGGVRNLLYLVAQYYNHQSSATVRCRFGYNTELKSYYTLAMGDNELNVCKTRSRTQAPPFSGEPGTEAIVILYPRRGNLMHIYMYSSRMHTYHLVFYCILPTGFCHNYVLFDTVPANPLMVWPAISLTNAACTMLCQLMPSL